MLSFKESLLRIPVILILRGLLQVKDSELRFSISIHKQNLCLNHQLSCCLELIHKHQYFHCHSCVGSDQVYSEEMRMILHPVRLSSVEAQQQKLSSELSVKLGYVYFFSLFYIFTLLTFQSGMCMIKMVKFTFT